MTLVRANTAVYSTNYVATNMLRSIKQIVAGCGLNPSKMGAEMDVLEDGVATWLASRHLQALVLEVFDPSRSTSLVGRFDFTIDYGYYSNGDGDLWMDPDTVHLAIRKAGSYPSLCSYDFLADCAPGHPPVTGWSSAAYRSIDGFRRYNVGTAVGGGSLGAGLAYYRKA